jgi:hypothetical protein
LYAAKNINEIKHHKVIVNVQLVVFALCWFGTVCSSLSSRATHTQNRYQGEVEFPKDEASFLEAIAVRSQQLGVTLTHEAMGQLKEAMGTNILRAVGGCFMLATSVSPLLMLIPKKYHAKGIAFRRDALVAVSSCHFLMFSANHFISSYSTACLWGTKSRKVSLVSRRRCGRLSSESRQARP